MELNQSMQNLLTSQTQNAAALARQNNKFSSDEAEKQRKFEQALFNQGNEFNATEAAKNRNWQLMASNTAHQREIQDLKAAGLNPILSATGGNGATVTSGATASSLGAPSGAHATPDTSASAATAQVFGSLMSYLSNTDAMKTSAESAQRIADLQAKTQMAIADITAAANKYSSDNAYLSSVYGSHASMYNTALNAATNKAISAAQLAQQQKLAEFDYEKQMEYKAYERDTQYENLNHQLYNELTLRKEEPTTATGFGMKAIHNAASAVKSIVSGIGNALSGSSVRKGTGKF